MGVVLFEMTMNGGRRGVVLGLYRDLVCAARLLEPPAHSAEALTAIRAAFKQKADLQDSGATQIDDLIKEGRERLGYVRTIVPLTNRRKMKLKMRAAEASSSNGSDRFVVDRATGQVVSRTHATGQDKRTKWDH